MQTKSTTRARSRLADALGRIAPFARPGRLLPIFLAAVLLLLALKLGDLGQVLGRVRAVPARTLLVALGMAAIYLLLKGWQLRLLLANLGMRPDWRSFALAFGVGELLVTLPLGVFAQNWILSATGPTRFGASSAATVLMLAAETLVLLALLALAGIPGWPEVRPAAAACAAGLLLTGIAATRFERLVRAWAAAAPWPLLRRALEGLSGLLHALDRLANWRGFALNLLFAAAYLGALAFAFERVGLGVGVSPLPFLTAATIYAASLAAVLMFGGLVSQIGAIELVGMGAARAWGIGFDDSLALMLGFRLVWTGAVWLLSLPVVLTLWSKTLRKRRPRPRSGNDLEEAPH